MTYNFRDYFQQLFDDAYSEIKPSEHLAIIIESIVLIIMNSDEDYHHKENYANKTYSIWNTSSISINYM